MGDILGGGDPSGAEKAALKRQRNIQSAQSSKLRIREAEEERRRKSTSRASAAARNIQSAGRLVAAASSPRLPSRLGV